MSKNLNVSPKTKSFFLVFKFHSSEGSEKVQHLSNYFWFFIRSWDIVRKLRFLALFFFWYIRKLRGSWRLNHNFCLSSFICPKAQRKSKILAIIIDLWCVRKLRDCVKALFWHFFVQNLRENPKPQPLFYFWFFIRSKAQRKTEIHAIIFGLILPTTERLCESLAIIFDFWCVWKLSFFTQLRDCAKTRLLFLTLMLRDIPKSQPLVLILFYFNLSESSEVVQKLNHYFWFF